MRNLMQWAPYREQVGPSELWGVREREPDGEGKYKIIITARPHLDGEDADLIARSHNARLTKGERQLWYESIVSHRTGQPVYRFQFDDKSWEFSLSDLRIFIAEMNQLLEAGLTDAFLARWVSKFIMPDASGDDHKRILGHLMVEFRQYRETLNNPPTETVSVS